MEHNSTETVDPDIKDETVVVDGEEVTAEKSTDKYKHLLDNISQYVQENHESTNTQLFAFLALLNAYVPESFLLMSECQQILGPPDPIHGGPPFEERMEPFSLLINTSNSSPEHVSMVNPVIALRAVNLLAHLKISRSTTVKKLMSSLCGNQAQPHTIQFIKDLLTKREMGKKGKEKFSRLIEDILGQENFYNAVSVLKTASEKFKSYPFYPQTLSRLYYIRGGTTNCKLNAVYWANEAINRAPKNSYMADILGQIYKKCLMEAKRPEDVRARAQEAFNAFKDVEEKAEKEESPEKQDRAGAVSISISFNNRGLFGFIQVAKIVFEKSRNITRSDELRRLIKTKRNDVEAKFDFFEWYLTYSKPDMTTLEPWYFWKDVAICYESYTKKTAAESRSFPGLLDCLNHGLFMSKGRRATFEEVERNVSDFEEIQGALKTTYEENADSVEAAERYILSNFILSNKMPNSPHLTPMTELKTIIHRFLSTEVGQRSPEFYLLVLLLFWPEEQIQLVQDDDDKEVKQQATDGSEDKSWEDKISDEEQETGRETAQLPLDLMFAPDLEQCVTFMEKAFDAKYAKYLRGRYLLPLFFLGKGSGLSKWIHKSKLDAIVERKVDTELPGEGLEKSKKERRINEMWIKGEVWQVPEVKDILLLVAVEPCYSHMVPQEDEESVVEQVEQKSNEQEMFVCAGGKKIKATTEVASDASVHSPMLFYLGFTIEGPVVFKVGPPHMSGQ